MTKKRCSKNHDQAVDLSDIFDPEAVEMTEICFLAEWLAQRWLSCAMACVRVMCVGRMTVAWNGHS